MMKTNLMIDLISLEEETAPLVIVLEADDAFDLEVCVELHLGSSAEDREGRRRCGELQVGSLDEGLDQTELLGRRTEIELDVGRAELSPERRKLYNFLQRLWYMWS